MVISLFCGAGLWFLLGALGGEALGIVGAMVGFLAPNVVYFGNRVK